MGYPKGDIREENLSTTFEKLISSTYPTSFMEEKNIGSKVIFTIDKLWEDYVVIRNQSIGVGC